MRITDEARLKRAVRDGDEAEIAEVINGLSRMESWLRPFGHPLKFVMNAVA